MCTRMSHPTMRRDIRPGIPSGMCILAFIVQFASSPSQLVWICCLCHQEDGYLREQYPRYAETSSVFTVLSASDEMEVKQRTEEQIRARVKKLGLTAASPARPMEGGDDSDDDADEGPDDGNVEAGLPASGEEDNAMEDRADNPGSVKPFNVRKLKRKNQAESDDDSEGLFSSTEVNTDFEIAFESIVASYGLLDQILTRIFAAACRADSGLNR